MASPGSRACDSIGPFAGSVLTTVRLGAGVFVIAGSSVVSRVASAGFRRAQRTSSTHTAFVLPNPVRIASLRLMAAVAAHIARSARPTAGRRTCCAAVAAVAPTPGSTNPTGARFPRRRASHATHANPTRTAPPFFPSRTRVDLRWARPSLVAGMERRRACQRLAGGDTEDPDQQPQARL